MRIHIKAITIKQHIPDLINDKTNFVNLKSDIKTLQKKLKIVNKPYKNTYVTGINLQGKYLTEFGFKYGDMVELTISKNRILIESIVKSKS